MIDWIKKILNNEDLKEIPEWETDNSILAYLKRNIKEDGSLNHQCKNCRRKKGCAEINLSQAYWMQLLGLMYQINRTPE